MWHAIFQCLFTFISPLDGGLGGWVVMVVDFWPQAKHYWHEYILRWNSSVMASINLPKAWGFNDQFVITVQAFLHHTSDSYDFAENLITESDNKTYIKPL